MLHPPAPYHLRSMRLSDIDAVMVIEEEAFPTPWRASGYEYEITRNRVATYQVLTAQLADRPARLIGYSGHWLLVEEVHVSTIAVSPAWRGRGLGELLLLNLILLAYRQTASLVTLEVRRSNKVAQSLYEKYNFQYVGERRRYYQGKEDALLMTVAPLDASYRSFLRGRQETLFRRLEVDALQEDAAGVGK